MFLQRSWRSSVKRPLWAAFERRLLGHARFVHAVSAGDAETVRRLGVAVPVSIVPNGVDIPDGGFPPIADGAPWLFIGRLHAEGKGLDALIEGYAIASQRISLPVLLIRGPDFRGGRAALELLIHRLGLGDRVEVGGPVAGDEKRRLLESCGLFLLPSRREGLPLSVLEALAAARPVAVTLGTNLDEAVRRSGAGFVIAAPAAQAVAETLEAAAAVDPRQLTEMGRRGQALAREEFSWNRAAGTVNDLYERHFA
jgi:glycosyltransferase involved in cell wall biosynthesis